MSPEEEIRQVEKQLNDALVVLMGGDAGPLKAMLSQRDDATAFLGWGGYERGWDQIDGRWDWAMAQFAALNAQGRTIVWRSAEQLATVVSGDLAYAVTIERSAFTEPGRLEPREQTLRVTHIYRREPDGWKLAHRHVDRLAEQRSPAP